MPSMRLCPRPTWSRASPRRTSCGSPSRKAAVEPGRAVFVGDTVWDVQARQHAGVWVHRGPDRRYRPGRTRQAAGDQDLPGAPGTAGRAGRQCARRSDLSSDSALSRWCWTLVRLPNGPQGAAPSASARPREPAVVLALPGGDALCLAAASGPIRPLPSRNAALGEAPDNRDALYQEITRVVVPPGLIAYVDDQPAGWTRVGPRAAFPGVQGNKALARVLTDDDDGVWWVTCFAVDGRHRRTGVGLALLKAAVEFARQHGATAVEGHPVDVAGLKTARARAVCPVHRNQGHVRRSGLR